MPTIFERNLDVYEKHLRNRIQGAGTSKQIAYSNSQWHRRVSTILLCLLILAVTGCISATISYAVFVITGYGNAKALASTLLSISFFLFLGLKTLYLFSARYRSAFRMMRDCLMWISEDGTFTIPYDSFFLYLRSFAAEWHYYDSTEQWVGHKVVRIDWHTGFLVKKSLAALADYDNLIQAINLSEYASLKNAVIEPRAFRCVCLYEYPDWPDKIELLCREARIVILHFDDYSEGLHTEFFLVTKIASRAILIFPGQIRTHVEELLCSQGVLLSDFRAVFIYESRVIKNYIDSKRCAYICIEGCSETTRQLNFSEFQKALVTSTLGTLEFKKKRSFWQRVKNFIS